MMITQEIKLYQEPAPYKPPPTVIFKQDDVDKAVAAALAAGVFPGNIYKTPWHSEIVVVSIKSDLADITHYKQKPAVVKCKVTGNSGHVFDSMYTVEEILGYPDEQFGTAWELVRAGSVMSIEHKSP